jgi:hypothetical protein
LRRVFEADLGVDFAAVFAVAILDLLEMQGRISRRGELSNDWSEPTPHWELTSVNTISPSSSQVHGTMLLGVH